MPRVSRVKVKQHASAAQLPTQRVDEAELDVTIPDEIRSVVPEAGSSKKKGSAADLVPASLLTQPYSKSHRKRLNKKSRQDLSGGQLHPLAAALAESLGQKGEDDKKARVRTKQEKEKERADEELRKREEGKIGEGRGKTLGEKKRRDLISEEAKRRDAVMNHVQFKSNPWATIRMHAGNSLAVKEGVKEKATPVVAEKIKLGGMDVD